MHLQTATRAFYRSFPRLANCVIMGFAFGIMLQNDGFYRPSLIFVLTDKICSLFFILSDALCYMSLLHLF